MIFIKLIYAANIVVAGWIGVTSLLYPKTASASVFSNAYQPTEVIRLTGCLWLAIAVLSAAGLFWPLTFSPVLALQLIYKSCWLIIVALPFVIPWKYLWP